MTVLPLAAAAIRAAMSSDAAEQDLADVGATGDGDAAGGLLEVQVAPDDLRWMSPGEWRWYAAWRQRHGGSLDPVLLDHLARESRSSRARYEVRALCHRDPPSIDSAARPEIERPDREEPAGLRQMRRQADAFGTAQPLLYELIDDCLQLATEVSWFTLRLLTAERKGSPLVGAARERLAAIAEARRIDAELRQRWFGF